ncbi:MAG: peptide deformylase [bacterium]
MALYKIVIYPDPMLKRKAEEVHNLDHNIIKTIKDMTNTMYASKGIGLAGPQVGILSRVAVIDTSFGKDISHPLVLINPRIIEQEGYVKGEEGCLSFPNMYAPVARHERVLIEYIDKKGKEVRFEARDFLARVLQHEIDHLEGVCFIDRLSKIRRDIIKRKFLKKR